MADFVAVLKKTIDALGDNTPAMREKVYQKARSTIAAKLAAINPPPPHEVTIRDESWTDSSFIMDLVSNDPRQADRSVD